MFTVAAAPLRMPKALMMGGGMRSWGWLMRKFSSDRSVCAPQYLSAGTWISPKASVSARVAAGAAAAAAMLEGLAWKDREDDDTDKDEDEDEDEDEEVRSGCNGNGSGFVAKSLAAEGVAQRQSNDENDAELGLPSRRKACLEPIAALRLA
jgi:hypothetical protein